MTDLELLQAIGQVVEAKMEPMRQDIRDLKEDIGQLKQDVGILKEDVGVLKQEVSMLKEDVGVLKQDVGMLKEDVSMLKEDTQTLKGEVRELQQNYSQLEAKVDGVRIYIDTDLHRTLNLLMEGQQAVLDRVTPTEKYEALEIRTSALEMAVKQHSAQIQELMYA